MLDRTQGRITIAQIERFHPLSLWLPLATVTAAVNRSLLLGGGGVPVSRTYILVRNGAEH